jgi:hypothetical protein
MEGKENTETIDEELGKRLTANPAFRDFALVYSLRDLTEEETASLFDEGEEKNGDECAKRTVIDMMDNPDFAPSPRTRRAADVFARIASHSLAEEAAMAWSCAGCLEWVLGNPQKAQEDLNHASKSLNWKECPTTLGAITEAAMRFDITPRYLAA